CDSGCAWCTLPGYSNRTCRISFPVRRPTMAATKKKTWTIHRYIEAPGEPSPVLAWLRVAAAEAEEITLPRGVAFHFRLLGEQVVADDNSVDVHRSPLVTVFVPQVRRGILWTVGEVHFWATPLRQLYP